MFARVCASAPPCGPARYLRYAIFGTRTALVLKSTITDYHDKARHRATRRKTLGDRVEFDRVA